jgi:hypothetical protein
VTWDWHVYLEIARALEGGAQSSSPPYPEALLRAAASRAYYAAYNVALGLARHHGYKYTKNGTGVHQSLIVWFKTSGMPSNGPAIGVDLDRARKCRVNADYKDALPGTRTWSAEAANAIRYSEQVIAAVRTNP